MCQKVSGTGSYDLYFKIMLIKHAEQTTLKQQENTVFPPVFIQRWIQQKQKLMPVLFENCHLYRFKDRMKCKFHATSLLNETKILSLAQGDVYNDGGILSHYSDTFQEVTTALGRNVK
jgi:hypothetical protein